MQARAARIRVASAYNRILSSARPQPALARAKRDRVSPRAAAVGRPMSALAAVQYVYIRDGASNESFGVGLGLRTVSCLCTVRSQE